MKNKIFRCIIAPTLALLILITPICTTLCYAQDKEQPAAAKSESYIPPSNTVPSTENKTDKSDKTEKEDSKEKEKEKKKKEEKSKKIKSQIASVQKEIDLLKNQSDKIEEYQMALETKTTLLQAEIEALNEELAPVEQSVKENEAAIKKYKKKLKPMQKEVSFVQDSIAEIEEKINGVYGDFCQKQKTFFMNGYSSSLELLFGAEDFADFLMRLQLLTRISKIDADNLSKLESELDIYEQRLEKLRGKLKEVEELKEKIETASQKVKAQKKIIKTKTQSLKDEQRDLIKSMEEYSKNLQKLYSKQFDASAQVAQLKEIDNILHGLKVDEKGTGVNSYRTTGFKWPTPSCKYISCGFYGYSNHNGMDIPCSYGSNVCAIAGGTVVKVVHQTTSYGNYIIIYHGDGIYSLYAHNSVLKVSVGQSVAQGDVIARSGNSGNVRPRPSAKYPYAGSHLHLGIQKNGVWVNPQNYVSP